MGEELVAALARLGGDVDDVALAPLAHPGDHGFDAEEDALRVDVHDEVPVFLGDVGDLLHRDHARVVDQDVDPAERLIALGDHLLNLLAVGHVAGEARDRAAAARDFLGGLANAVAVDVGDHQVGALAEESFGDRPSHPRGATGYQNPTSLEPVRHASSPSR